MFWGRGRVGICAGAFLFFSWNARSAHAEQAAAEALFRDGRNLLERGDTAGACARFGASERLEPAPGTELNLAICHEKLGRLARAWQFLQQALHALPSDDSRAEGARLRLAELEPRLAFMTLRAEPGLPENAVLKCGADIYTRAAFGVRIPFDLGGYACRVEAPGHLPRRLDLAFDTAAAYQVPVAPGARLAPRPVEQRPSPGSTRPWATASGGGAAAALLSSIALGIGALQNRNTVEQECDRSGCSRAGLAAAERGETFALASTTAFVGSVVLGLLSATLFFTSDDPAQVASVPSSARDLP